MTSGDESGAEDQVVRTELRASFLQAVSELIDQPCKILTYERSALKATFAGCKPDGSEILVRGLETPAAVKIDAALLRTPDILVVQFVGPSQFA